MTTTITKTKRRRIHLVPSTTITTPVILTLVLLLTTSLVDRGECTSSSYTAPELSFRIRDGDIVDLGGFEPTFKWSTNGTSQGFDYEGGIDVTAKDFDNVPYKLWGKITRTYQGWGLSARADVDAEDWGNIDLDMEADNREQDASVRMRGCIGKTFSVSKIEVKKGVGAPGGRFSLNPRYDALSAVGDVTLTYDVGKYKKTSIIVDASVDDQQLTVSHNFGDNFIRVTPSVSAHGKVALQLEKTLDEGKRIMATVKPNDSINVLWENGSWTANINAPMDGFVVDGVNVSVKRKLNF